VELELGIRLEELNIVHGVLFVDPLFVDVRELEEQMENYYAGTS
jgi:hypothetical protein